ncbi:hypothetical protein Tco_0742159 [Tanacetum coccineum]
MIMEIWCLGSGNGGVSVVVRGGEMGGVTVAEEGAKCGALDELMRVSFNSSKGSDMKRELRVSCYTDAGYLTDDVEYIAAFDASKEAVWIRKFIYGLGVVPTIEEPINMYCDNTGAIAIAKYYGVTKGARPFRAKVHYVREAIEMGDVRIEKVHTNDNLADPFRKALPYPKHSELTRNIGMIPASSLM